MKVCNVRTKKQYDSLMKLMEDLGWKEHHNEFFTWHTCKPNTHIELKDNFQLHVRKCDDEELLTYKEAKAYLKSKEEKRCGRGGAGGEPVIIGCDPLVFSATDERELGDYIPERIPTWDTLAVDDVLIGENGHEITIIHITGPIYFHKNEDGWSAYSTIEEFKGEGFTIKTPQNEPKRSLDDVLSDLSEEDKELIEKALKH